MKKNVFIVLFVMIVLGAIAWFLLTRGRSMAMEQIFPAQTLMYIRLSHLSKDLTQYSQSEFWKNVSSIDLPKVLEHNNVSQEDIKSLQNVQKEMETFFTNPLTKKFLGTEIAAGVYDKGNVESKEANSYDLLFATRLGFSLQMAELFVSMAHQWSDEITTTNEHYQGFNIVHVHFSKRKLDLQYVRLHDVLLASLFPSNILHEVVDVHRKRKPSLFLDNDFSQSFSHTYPQSHGIFYMNIQRLLEMVNQHVPTTQKKNFQQMSQASVGFKSYTISFMPGDISKMRMIMQFEPAKLNHYWSSLLTCAGSQDTSLKFIPHDVVAYYGGQCYDFKEMWKDVNNETQITQSKGGFEKWEHRLEKRFKLSIPNDVLPVLGSQVGWYLNDVDTQGLFPYPRGAAFIKIENRQAAEGLMQKLTKNSPVPLQQEDYQQSSIHYLPLPLGVNMDPGYTILGDYLLLGSSRETLKTSIDAFYNSNHSLSSSDILKQFNINASNQDQGVAFIKIDDVSGRLQQLLDWYNKVVSSQITGSLAYQQEVQDRQKELNESFAEKKEELSLAQKKLKKLQSQTGQENLSDEEKANQQANLDHLTSDIKILKEDVESYGQQDKELRSALITYKNQAEAAKLWLFNSDEVFKPLLKAFESLHALGMKWSLNSQMSETEIFIK